MTNKSSNKILDKIICAIAGISLVIGSSIPFVSTSLNGNCAYAVPSSTKQAEAQEALTKLTELQKQLGQAENDYNEAYSAQVEAQNKMEEAKTKIEEYNGKIANLQGQLGTRAKNMYMTGASTLLDLVLGATSFQAFSTNWDLLNSMNQKDSNLVAESKSVRAELNEQKKTLEEQEKIAAEKTEKANSVMTQAQSLVANQKSVYDKLSTEAAELLQQEQAAREASNQQAAINAINNGTAGNSNGSNNSNNGGGSSNSGGGNVNNNKPQTVTGNVVVDRAYAQIGKPYVWGGVGPNGFDCSGLVSYCITGRNARLGTTYTFMNYTRVSNPQPGDIVTSSYHAGIYIGNGQMIHAPYPGASVCVAAVMSDMIYVRY